MIKFKDLREAGGAGDWGTDEARKRLQKDTPGQSITDMGMKNKERKESEHKVIKVVGDDFKNMKKDRVYGTFPATNKGRDQATLFQLRLKRQKGVEATLVWESLDEGAVAVSTVEKEIRSNGGTQVKKDDRSITFTLNGTQRKVPVDRGFVQDRYYMQLQKMFEEVELDEGTLAASDGSVVDALLTAVKEKLMKDLSSGNVDDANEIAKMVKMTIEKDYKRKGFSRLKR